MTEENCCEHGDHAAPPGKRFCSAACAACEAGTGYCSECGPPCDECDGRGYDAKPDDVARLGLDAPTFACVQCHGTGHIAPTPEAP